MYRVLFEVLVLIVITMLARSMLSSLLRGVSTASKTFQNDPNQPLNAESAKATGTPPKNASSELHKDPVCGTYVAESTEFQRRSTGQVFYYCSTGCREKHVPVAR